MYLVTEKDEYSEVDLLDYDCLIKKANKRFKVNIIISIVILGIAAIVALIGLLMKLKVIPLIFNLRAYDVLMTSLFLLFPFFISSANMLGKITELKNLKNGRKKVEIYLENHKNKDNSQVFNDNNEVAVNDNIIVNEEVINSFNHDDSLCVVESPNKEPGGNGGINTAFNILWFIFVGLWEVIINFFTGIAYCLTIIGIPAGITCFKFIPLIFRPAGREVILKYGSHPVLNTLNLIFGGLISYVLCSIYGCILCVTIIGIPLGRQMFKIGKLFLAPFGSMVVLKDQYTENRDLDYDLEIFINQLCLEDRNVKLNDGRVVPASEAMKLVLTKEDREDIIKKLKKYETIEVNSNGQASVTVAFPGIKINQSCIENVITNLFGILGGGLIGVLVLYLIIFIFNLIWDTGITNFFKVYPTEGLLIIVFYLIMSVIYTIITTIKFNKNSKVIQIIKPAYLQKWKNITTYYPTKFTTSARQLRKQAKNPTNRKEYVIAQSLPSMIHKILK